MLPIISKLLTVQIITASTLITLMLLSSSFPTTESLPITSKPIESTVENLAWEAWLMVPVAQQQKSRKVTPKSIFIVPQKKNNSSSVQCPPGEHLYESRCIPTINIDTDKILLTQLTNLVLTSGDYDYDYNDDINDSPGAEKLEGGQDLIPSTIVNTANSPDEPLKFDIFRDNFPIGSGDFSGGKEPDDENVFFVGERRRKPPVPPDMAIPDLDTDSSSYGSQNEGDSDDAKDNEEESSLFLSGIDAILVPAVSDTRGKDQNLNFSVYQDVANTTTTNVEVDLLTPIAEKNEDLGDILEEESLFPDKDHQLKESEVTTTERTETTTDLAELEASTMKIDENEDVESKTEFIRSVTEIFPVEQESTNNPTEPTDITSTLVAEQETITPTMMPSEETTLISEEITTITRTEDETTIVSVQINQESTVKSTTESEKDRAAITDRFIYHHLADSHSSPPPVIDIAAELKKINDLVASKRKPTTPKTPSVEASNSSDLWAKIIPVSSPNSIATTSVTPDTSTSTEMRSTSSASSTVDSQGSDTSSTDPTSPYTPSTPQTPALAESNPFWWLPTSWSGNRTDVDRPLLLRFWSALSGIGGSQTKV